MSELVGTRVLVSKATWDMKPGEYKLVNDTVLWACLPNGQLFRVDERWLLVEHEDGTISANARPPNAASSLKLVYPGQPEKNWHGHLKKGVFTW